MEEEKKKTRINFASSENILEQLMSRFAHRVRSPPSTVIPPITSGVHRPDGFPADKEGPVGIQWPTEKDCLDRLFVP